MIAWMLACVVILGYVKRVDIFDAFSAGAKEGMNSAVSIIPFLAASLTALRVLEASGAMESLFALCEPVLSLLGLPSGVIPLFVIRPLSGSASLALLQDILNEYGPDSRTGLIASAMMGSGETVLYTCAVYLSAAGIKKSAYVIPASLLGWTAGCIVSGLFF